MYIDDIKLLAQNEKELETLIQAIRIYRDNIGIDFDIVKCAIFKITTRKPQITEGIELPIQGKIRTLGIKRKLTYI